MPILAKRNNFLVPLVPFGTAHYSILQALAFLQQQSRGNSRCRTTFGAVKLKFDMKKYINLLKLVVCLVSAALYGCSNSDADQISNVAFTVESSGDQAGIQNQQFQVITNDSQYSSLLSTITIMPPEKPPSVDFSNKNLAAVFAGMNIGCSPDLLSVESVIETDNTVTVSVKRTIGNSPETVCIALVPVINGGPYVFISMPKTNKLVSLSIE